VILHRSLLFVPGGRSELLEKAARFPADVLCIDLEESVLPAEKAAAREPAAKAVEALAGAGRTVQVRLNSIQSGETRDDLAAVVRPELDSVVLAKTESAQDVRDADVLLREQELAHDVKPGTIGLVVAIESARALLACTAIAGASTRLVALMLGAEDFTFDMGVARTREGRELDYARQVIATNARAGGLAALDTPWADIQDVEGLRADAERARGLGFGGKYAVHPDQLAPIHEVFTPSEAELAAARKVLAAWEEAQARGRGAVQLEGRMIDRPVAERARLLVEQAQAIAN